MTGAEFNSKIGNIAKDDFDSITKIIAFVGNLKDGFTIDDNGSDFVNFSTRDHGNVGDETPGKEDIVNAKYIESYILQNFPNVDVEIETVDEWVYVNCNLKKKSLK